MLLLAESWLADIRGRLRAGGGQEAWWLGEELRLREAMAFGLRLAAIQAGETMDALVAKASADAAGDGKTLPWFDVEARISLDTGVLAGRILLPGRERIARETGYLKGGDGLGRSFEAEYGGNPHDGTVAPAEPNAPCGDAVP